MFEIASQNNKSFNHVNSQQKISYMHKIHTILFFFFITIYVSVIQMLEKKKFKIYSNLLPKINKYRHVIKNKKIFFISKDIKIKLYNSMVSNKIKKWISAKSKC